MKNRFITVLVFSDYYLPGYKGGGPIKTVKNLFDQVGEEISFKLITLNHDLEDTVPYSDIESDVWNTVGNAKVFYISRGTAGYKQIIKIMLERGYQVIYLNSFFSPTFSLLPLLIAKSLRQKVVLGPRGEFSEGALKLKSQKKNVFIKMYKLLGLHHGVIYQASSNYEADDIKRVLGANVDIQIAEDIGAQQFSDTLILRETDNLKIVFVSRISPMKNLLLALEILKNVRQTVSYDIYGPIEDQEYWVKCESVIDSLPSNIQVNYRGELRPEEVIDTISTYDLFFMPTKGENYGHVIAEALCAGLPLLIADTTPWRNLQKQGIGWDLSLINPEAFSTVIDELAIMPSKEHHQMREKVLAWAKNKFNQRDAIDANIAMFKYAANK